MSPGTMGLLVARAFYLFAPLLFSAALSGVVLHYDWLRALRRPIDGGRTFRGRRIFGENKTWRGVAVAIVGCILTVALQRFFVDRVPSSLPSVDYGSVSPVVFGGAMGAGAMAGELPNSFVKRQLGIAPGKTSKGARALLFYVWDQVDLLLGAWPAIAWWVHPGLGIVAASFVVVLALHPVVAWIGFGLGLRATAR